MQYVVIELQDNLTTVANLVWAYDNVAQAEAKYHTVLAAAAVSQVPIHSAVMLGSDGRYIKSECYDHRTESEE